MQQWFLVTCIRLWLWLGWNARAAQLLAAYLEATPNSAWQWRYVALLETMDRPLDERLHAYRRGVALDPHSAQAGPTWYQIGLFEEQRGQGMAAVAAYLEAERLGVPVPELERYYLGNWEMIPGFESHPDSRYPTICSVDLEVAPRADLALDERIFEVGLVRFRGQTRLATYQTTIGRDWRPALPTDQALTTVVPAMLTFLGTSWLTGHNLRAFDAQYLRALGLAVPNERILDTLEVARLLAPESPRHDLATLCASLGIALKHWHQALDDAEAAAHLLLALGDFVAQQSRTVLAGLCALVPPGSAFETILLRPHGLQAHPHLAWDFDPTPSPPRLFPERTNHPPSGAVAQALQHEQDAFVELDDPDGAYVAALLEGPRTLVLVGTSRRLDRMAAIAAAACYILPSPHTLLCPEALRQQMATLDDPWQQVQLFCTYQTSHNHDATRLWLWRHGSPKLRLALASACCPSAAHRCAGQQAVAVAMATAPLILATHQIFFAQATVPSAERLILDDVSRLPADLPQLLATRVASEELHLRDDPQVQQFMRALAGDLLADQQQSRRHQRFALAVAIRWLAPLLAQSTDDNETLRLFVERLRGWSQPFATDARLAQRFRAAWLDLWTNDQGEVTRWAFARLDVDLVEAFRERLWQPYALHLFCDRSVTLGARQTTFLQEMLGLPTGLPLYRDPRPRPPLLLPTPDQLPGSPMLRRRAYGMAVGQLLVDAVQTPTRRVLVELQDPALLTAFTQAWRQVRPDGERVFFSAATIAPARLARIMAQEQRPYVMLVPSFLRGDLLDHEVDMVLSGPLRFASLHDPVLAELQRGYLVRHPERESFGDVVLPLALFELKRRLTHPSHRHLLLDGRLLRRGYEDVVRDALADVATLSELPDGHSPHEAWLNALGEALTAVGLPSHQVVAESDLLHLLRTYWGTTTFRPLTGLAVTQGDLIQTTLAGRDQLIIMPTGGGKSLCYQLPALVLAEDSPAQVTLVISPLIALMQNQVSELQRKGIFEAIAITSTLSVAERADALLGIRQGRYSLIYAAPEQITAGSLRRALQEREIGLVALDEAHCVSQWGHDFRPEYSRIKGWLEQHFGVGGRRPFPIIALTATARQRHTADETSTVEDIIARLGLAVGDDHERVIVTPPQRPELHFGVIPVRVALPCPVCQREMQIRDGQPYCQQCQATRYAGSEVTTLVDRAKGEHLVRLLTDPEDLGRRWRQEQQRGIIYCAYTRTTKVIADLLHRAVPNLRVGIYHGQLEDAEKAAALAGMTAEDASGLDVVIATNAFGMGIDLRWLGFVVHWDLPGTLEAYYQEAGRAGRDAFFQQRGQQAECLLLYHPADLGKQRFLRRGKTITVSQLHTLYRFLQQHQHRQETTALVLASDADLAASASLDVEQVGMALYYLEAQTTAGEAPVLRQDETVQHVRWLHLAPDGAANLATLPPSPARTLARHLLAQYHLTPTSATLLLEDDLARELGWSGTRVENALVRLDQAGVIVGEPQATVQWHLPSDEVLARLDHFQEDLTRCFRAIATSPKRQKVWKAGRSVAFDLIKAAQLFRERMEPAMLVRIIAVFLVSDGATPGPLALARPHRVRAGFYEVQAHAPDALLPTVERWCQHLREAAQQVLAVAPDETLTPVDLTHLASGRHRQRRLHILLRWLEMLGWLTYDNLTEADRLRQVVLLQPEVAVDELACDLTSLRVKEAQDAAKLDHMRQYAEDATDAQRQAWFEEYFAATHPLQVDAPSEAWMTEEQHALLTLPPGWHTVIAPAGGGKTRTLVAMARQLITRQHLAPERLLIVTHYRQGAAQVGRWLQREIPEAGQVLHAQTLHAFANAILQRFWTRLVQVDGSPFFKKSPQLIKGEIAWATQQRTWLELALPRWHRGEWTIPAALWPEDWDEPKRDAVYKPNRPTETDVAAAFVALREEGLFPQAYPSPDQVRAVLTFVLPKSIEPELVYALWIQVLELQGEAGCYGFADQVFLALALLATQPDIAQVYQGFYEAILVDEYQDLTPAAAALLHHLTDAQHFLIAFGDPEQDIRPRPQEGPSDSEAFLSGDGCGPHALTRNFRATQPILDLVLAVRNTKLPAQQRLGVLIAAQTRDGPLPQVHRLPPCADKQANLDQQVRYAVQLAVELQTRGVNTPALIVAKSGMMTPVEHVLRQLHVPYQRQGRSPWELSFIHPIVRLLRLIQSPQEEDVAWWLQHALVPYLTANHLQRLRAQQGQRSLWDTLQDVTSREAARLSEEQRAALERFSALVLALDATSTVEEVLTAFQELPDNPMRAAMGDEGRREELQAALDMVRRLKVTQALTEIMRMGGGVPTDELEGQVILLTTIDHAKSQEFRVVILLGLEELRHNRRFYVALSRAQEELHLIGTALGLLEKIPHPLYEVVAVPVEAQP